MEVLPIPWFAAQHQQPGNSTGRLPHQTVERIKLTVAADERVSRIDH
jgi:hypothetical protein